MKKVLIIFALLISAVSFTKAQGGGAGRGGTPEQRAERSMGLLPATLNLTAEQKTQVATIFLAQAKSQDSLRTASNGDFQSMIPKMQAMTTANDAKILALLNADQKATYQEYVKNRPTGFGGRGGQGGGAPAGGGR